METQLTEPAAAPDPVAGNRIDQQGDGGGVDAVGAELGALRHGAGDDGGGGGAEDGLENGVGPQGDAGGKDAAVILHDHGVKPAEEAGARAEHDAEADKPEARGADAEVHQVFHQDIAGVLARVKPASHMEKPACMKKTSAAPSSTQMVLTELNSIVVSSHFCRFLPANGSAYKKAMEPSER